MRVPNPFRERTEKDGLRELAAERAAQLREERRRRQDLGLTEAVYTVEDWKWLWRNGMSDRDKARSRAWLEHVKARTVDAAGEPDWNILYRRMLSILHQIQLGELPEEPGAKEIARLEAAYG